MEFPYELLDEIQFVRRDVSISPDLRPLQRIAEILLILRLNCIKQSATVLKLQLFDWGLKSPEGIRSLLNFSEMEDNYKFPIIRFDPFLNRAIGYGLGEDMLCIEENTGKIKASTFGMLFLNKIMESDEILTHETQTLREIGVISETKVINLFRKRFRQYV